MSENGWRKENIFVGSMFLDRFFFTSAYVFLKIIELPYYTHKLNKYVWREIWTEIKLQSDHLL